MMNTEFTAEDAFRNLAFLAHRFLMDDMTVQQAIDEAMTWTAHMEQVKPFAALAFEEIINQGIDDYLAHTYKDQSVIAWYGNPNRTERRAMFEVISGVCAKLRGES